MQRAELLSLAALLSAQANLGSNSETGRLMGSETAAIRERSPINTVVDLREEIKRAEVNVTVRRQ